MNYMVLEDMWMEKTVTIKHIQTSMEATNFLEKYRNNPVYCKHK